MSGSQREAEARAVASFYAERGWDASHVVAYILRRPEEPGEMGTGLEMIAVERAGHLLREGFNPGHDDEHAGGELAFAASCYAALAGAQSKFVPPDVTKLRPLLNWPWEARWWKPSNNKIKNLVRAGALLAAEIDRLVRAMNKAPSAESQLEMPSVKGLSDSERLDLIEKLDADLTSDGGAGDGPTIWTMFWRVGFRNERIGRSVEAENVRAVIDKAAQLEGGAK